MLELESETTASQPMRRLAISSEAEISDLLASFLIRLFFNRRAIAVYSFTRALVVVVFSLGLLGLSGCAEDNETEAQKLAKTAGNPGPPAASKIKAAQSDLPPPRTSEEAHERTGADPHKNMPSDYGRKQVGIVTGRGPGSNSWPLAQGCISPNGLLVSSFLSHTVGVCPFFVPFIS